MADDSEFFGWLEMIKLDSVKGIVHPKMKILSSFTHSHIDTNDFISYVEHIRYSEESSHWSKQQ